MRKAKKRTLKKEMYIKTNKFREKNRVKKKRKGEKKSIIKLSRTLRNLAGHEMFGYV